MGRAADLTSGVLIAGAGPVGLALAVELTCRGVPTRVVDKTAGTKSISKALILHARTQEVFDAMGVIARAKAVSVPMTNVQVHAYGRRLGAWAFDRATVDSPHCHPLILGQDRTERLLYDRLRELGGEVEWRTEAFDYEQDDDGVTVRLRRPDGSEEAVRAAYPVGCEGAHSMTRKRSGLDFAGDAYTGEQFIQADCRLRWDLPHGSSYLFLTDAGYLMAIEMPDGILRVFISLPDPDPSLDAPPTLEDVRDNLVRLTGHPAELTDPVWLARYRTSHRRAPTFRRGRAFIAGDAAHVHVPIGGQGMNTGLQDAFNLGWKLAAVLAGESPQDLLDTYAAERVPVAEQLLSGTDRAYRFVLHPGELMKRAIRTFGPFLMSLHRVQEAAVTTLEEIRIAYYDGPLSEGHGGGRPAAGERAPDGTVVRHRDLETVRMFDVLRTPRWTLLAFAGTEPDETASGLVRRVAARFGAGVDAHLVLAAGDPPAGVPVLLDRERFLHDRYEAREPTAVLVRPDWYVGLRAPAADEATVFGYLGRWLAAGD